MRLPDPLATRPGRLAAFFFLYLTEGIPSGFTGTAVATQMRRQGIDPAAIGGFLAVLYLPWALKWAYGPFVDVISSERWGRRRMWILLTQSLMVATILLAMAVSLKQHLALFTAVLLIHNLFSATQDVAIDALAIDVLREDERGLANGLMFGGQYLGTAVGGAGVLFLTPVIGFQSTFVFVAAAIALVTILVPLPMREPPGAPRESRASAGFGAVIGAMGQFVRAAAKAFVSSRGAIAAIFLAFLPMGAYALALSLQSNLAVELGLDDREIASLSLASTVLMAGFCILGGWLSDRYGRRRTLALFIAGTAIPTLALAIAMHRFGWILPISPQAPNRPPVPHDLVRIFWILTLAYSVFEGLMYGVGTAIYMDVTTPRVAATQFTAYMAVNNFCFAYSAAWQGSALQHWGYPVTLTLDGLLGLVCLLILPWMGAVGRKGVPPPGASIPERLGP